MKTAIQSTQSLHVAPAANTAETIARLTKQADDWRKRCEKAEAQLRERANGSMALAILAAGTVAVVRTPDGEYCVLQSVAQFHQPETALLHARNLERQIYADAALNE